MAAPVFDYSTQFGDSWVHMFVPTYTQPLSEFMFHRYGSRVVLLGINPEEVMLPTKKRFKPKQDRGLVWELEAKRGHALCFSSTGGGKNTNIITPALLNYSGSVFVLDPKGENAWITAERRRQLGQKVVILDPWDQVNKVYGSKAGVHEAVSRFNPLAGLDPRSSDFNEDVTSIADGLIITSEGSEPHWADSARELIAGLIAAVIEATPGVASFGTVRRLITATDGELIKVVTGIVRRDPSSLAARKLRRFIPDPGNKTTNEIRSIRSTADTQTSMFDASRLIINMESVKEQEDSRASFTDAAVLMDSMETAGAGEDAFSLAELATARVSLFIVLPPDKLQSHGRWMRLIIQLALKAIARQPTPPTPPILFILDELGTINPGSGLRMIEQAYGLLGAQGIRIWGFFQDINQIRRDYPATWGTFIANSETIQILAVNEMETAQYFSNHIGTFTIFTSQSASPRPARLPHEIMRMPGNHVLSLWAGKQAFELPTLPYYQEPRWDRMYRPNPLFTLPEWAGGPKKPSPVDNRTALGKLASAAGGWVKTEGKAHAEAMATKAVDWAKTDGKAHAGAIASKATEWAKTDGAAHARTAAAAASEGAARASGWLGSKWRELQAAKDHPSQPKEDEEP